MAGVGPRSACGASASGAGAICARAIGPGATDSRGAAGIAAPAAAGAGSAGAACSVTRSAFDGTVSDCGCASAGDAAKAAAAKTKGGLRSDLLIFLGRDGESNSPPVPDCSARRR
jgi:hypothetical protein